VRETLLIVVTSQAVLPDGREGGFDWISVAVPYWRLREAGVRVGFASPAGGKPPGDPATAQDPAGGAPGPDAAEDRHDAVAMVLGDAEAVRALSRTLRLDAVDPGEWHGVLVSDGLSGLWDLGGYDALDALLAGVWARGGVIGAIGTGTAVLARLRDGEGRVVVAGRAIAAPADAALRDRLGADGAEGAEGPEGPDGLVLPETALRAAGARVVVADTDGAGLEAVEDGRLVTAADARAGAHLALELRGALAIHAPAMERDAAAARADAAADGTADAAGDATGDATGAAAADGVARAP